MQAELAQAYPQLRFRLLAVNEAGHESGTALMSQGRTIPLLQDVDQDRDSSSDISKELWQTTYRDVVLVDAAGRKVDVYNLTAHDLANGQNYAALRQALVDVASNVSSWRNATRPLDVNNDGIVAPLDALLCINDLNQRTLSDATGRLRIPAEPAPPPYLDTNGDWYLTPLDALLIINEINARPNPAEGEATTVPASGPRVANSDTPALWGGIAWESRTTEESPPAPRPLEGSSSLPRTPPIAAAVEALFGLPAKPDRSGMLAEPTHSPAQDQVSEELLEDLLGGEGCVAG
jgi:hypothetical protein